MRLSELKIGEKSKIIKIDSRLKILKKRLSAMGFIRNEEVQVIRIAPLGDPIEIAIKGYSLSIRKKDAEKIEVEKLMGGKK